MNTLATAAANSHNWRRRPGRTQHHAEDEVEEEEDAEEEDEEIVDGHQGVVDGRVDDVEDEDDDDDFDEVEEMVEMVEWRWRTITKIDKERNNKKIALKLIY